MRVCRSDVVWFVFMAGVTVVLQVGATFDPETITDWKVWAVGVGAQAVRAMAAAGLTWIAKHGRGPDSDPLDPAASG